jgi:dephospho-CoA kinase
MAGQLNRSEGPLVVGLTGGIAAGKSAVARLFCELGAVHMDADQLARQVVAQDPGLLEAMVRAFGEGIVSVDGTLDRARLGSIVFNDPEARARLETLTHPAIAARARQELEVLGGAGQSAPIVYEAALLVETGRYRELDCLVVVVADMDVRLRRLMERDGFSEAEADQRFAAQMPQEEKARLADYIIDNSGPLDQTRPQVEDIWDDITSAVTGDGEGGQLKDET